MAFWYKNKKEELILRVRVCPNSSSLRIIEIGQDFVKIGLCATPQKGKANDELIKFLAKKLKLPKKNLSVIKGNTDKNKEIKITGLINMEVLYDN